MDRRPRIIHTYASGRDFSKDIPGQESDRLRTMGPYIINHNAYSETFPKRKNSNKGVSL
jgi:hypothetical protein